MSEFLSIPFKKIKSGAYAPQYCHRWDAAIDLRICEPVTVMPCELKLIKLGFAMELPTGFCAKIIGRSGLTLKGFIVFPGLIDETYRGEIGVLCYNKMGTIMSFEAGARIAQMLVEQANRVRFREVTELTETERGDHGFGSSGV